MNPPVPLRILRRGRQRQRQAEHGAESKNGESRYHGPRVYSPAVRQQARIAFKVARAMRRNWADRGVVLGGRRAGTGACSLALAGLEAPLRLIDDVDAPLAPHDAVVPVAAAKRFQ